MERRLRTASRKDILSAILSEGLVVYARVED